MITLDLSKIEHDYDRESAELQIRTNDKELTERQRDALEALMKTVDSKQLQFVLHDMILESIRETQQTEIIQSLIK